jgi:hypothetical protein
VNDGSVPQRSLKQAPQQQQKTHDIPAALPGLTPSEVELVMQALASCESTMKIRPLSLWAVRAALEAATTDGFHGSVVIYFPAKGNHPAEARFHMGVDLTSAAARN